MNIPDALANTNTLPEVLPTYTLSSWPTTDSNFEELRSSTVLLYSALR